MRSHSGRIRARAIKVSDFDTHLGFGGSSDSGDVEVTHLNWVDAGRSARDPSVWCSDEGVFFIGYTLTTATGELGVVVAAKYSTDPAGAVGWEGETDIDGVAEPVGVVLCAVGDPAADKHDFVFGAANDDAGDVHVFFVRENLASGDPITARCRKRVFQ